MPSQEQLRKRELWKLYGETRKMEADGLDYQTISRFVARQTAEWEEKVPGYQSLLNKLGIEDNPGERSARAAVQGFASNVAQGATLGGADELAGVRAWSEERRAWPLAAASKRATGSSATESATAQSGSRRRTRRPP
jgi:hypothetical protein